MAVLITTNQVLNNLVAEAEKLDDFEKQQLLTKAKLMNYLKAKKKPLAQYDSTKIKPATITEIDNWKHKSRAVK